MDQNVTPTVTPTITPIEVNSRPIKNLPSSAWTLTATALLVLPSFPNGYILEMWRAVAERCGRRLPASYRGNTFPAFGPARQHASWELQFEIRSFRSRCL